MPCLARTGVVLTALAALLLFTGCGVDVELPTDKPSTDQIKQASDSQIAAVEKAIQKKDLSLPAKAQRLANYLDNLKMNITLGEGSRYGNTAEAATAIDGIVAQLQAWCNRARTRTETGDTDEDRAELQAILDRASEVLAEVKVNR